MPIPDGEVLHANAIRFLIDSKKDDAANVLLCCASCSFDNVNEWGKWYASITLTGPRAVYDILEKSYDKISQAISEAFRAVIPAEFQLRGVAARVELSPIDSDWRTQLLDIIQGKTVDNQGVEITKERPITIWKNLRFRSSSEVRIAEALEKAGVLFLPNCRARLGPTDKRGIREADFLICLEGKWGVLEVDGEIFHPPTRTTQDHERDRLFQAHGILVVQHFDAAECRENADGVVSKFIEILRRA